MVTVALTDTQTSFTGGAGQDIVTIAAVATKAIAGGTATNNEIVWNANSSPTTLGTVTGFTTLGVGGVVNGQTFDLSVLTGFNSLDVQANSTGGVTTFQKVAAGTALAIDGSVTTGGVTYDTAAGTAGASENLNLTIGLAANAAGATVANLNAQDSTGADIGTVNIASTYTATGLTNVISNLDTAASTGGIGALNVSGDAGLTISAWTNAAAALTITNASTGTNANSFTLTDASLSSLTLRERTPQRHRLR